MQYHHSPPPIRSLCSVLIHPSFASLRNMTTNYIRLLLCLSHDAHGALMWCQAGLIGRRTSGVKQSGKFSRFHPPGGGGGK